MPAASPTTCRSASAMVRIHPPLVALRSQDTSAIWQSDQIAAGPSVVAIDSGIGLANATLQQRLVAVRLFYDHLVEEGRRETNPVGRGRYTPTTSFGGHRQRGLVPRFTKLPWIPSDEEWHRILAAARAEPLRNRLMLALAYDAALRREELCLLCTDDLDPAFRSLRVRAETTKSRRERITPYSAATAELMRTYLEERRAISRSRGPLFLSVSRRYRAAAITPWTWSKVVRGVPVRSGVLRFCTHTLRHLCLTDLARAGWELYAIATFAGHRSVATTLQYIHLSGRDLLLTDEEREAIDGDVLAFQNFGANAGRLRRRLVRLHGRLTTGGPSLGHAVLPRMPSESQVVVNGTRLDVTSECGTTCAITVTYI
jgi:integrase